MHQLSTADAPKAKQSSGQYPLNECIH